MTTSLSDKTQENIVDVISDSNSIKRLAVDAVSGLIPSSYDYLSLTYVTSGNGVGEIETVTYKKGGSSGTTVGTLTLAYDSDGRISTITKS